MEEIKLGGNYLFFMHCDYSGIQNFCTHRPPEQGFLQMHTLTGVSSPWPLPTEKVHWIINSKYVRWRSVPFPFVHSNVVAFSYNFGCKYNFFVCLSRSRPFIVSTLTGDNAAWPPQGFEGKKEKPNCERLCKCGQQSSPKCRSY